LEEKDDNVLPDSGPEDSDMDDPAPPRKKPVAAGNKKSASDTYQKASAQARDGLVVCDGLLI